MAGPQTPCRRVAILSFVTVAACLSTTAPLWVVEPGVIFVSGVQANVVTAPDTVAVGTSFTAVVTTLGSSSCTRAAGAHVGVSGLTATVVPFDSVPGDKHATCTSDLRAFPRDVSLTFGAAGQAAIAVAGRSEHGDTTITHPIVVR